MQIISHGAAREVTGTCHEIRANDRRILLDCGLFQGRRREAAAKNTVMDFGNISEIDALILSHAHMDHVGRVPLLVKRGFKAPVHCTFATKDLAAVMLSDAGYIQEKDEEFFCRHLKDSMMPCDGPLYTQKEALACIKLFKGQNYGDWFPVCPGIRAHFYEAGHIIGAVQIVLEITESGRTRRIGFSGDLGRATLPIIRDPVPMPPVELLICESTYGNRMHENNGSAKRHLEEVINRTAKRGGKILIPAFSLERTQEIVFDLHVLWDEKRIPPLPIVIDSPLASRVTEVFMKHPECYDKEMYDRFLGRQHNPFQFSLVRYTESVEESKALNGTPGPMVIMAGSGMCEAGRIRHHLRNELENPKNTVLAVGYMAENTLGRRLIDPSVQAIKIFDEWVGKKAEIIAIDAYSGHADMNDLDAYVKAIEGLEKVILVHGEMDQMLPFADRITQAKGIPVVIPERGEILEI